ncbi:MAG: glycosyltransferase family 2 protein [Nitrospirota bacterium]|nr:glycosyltransferase family 2 protein [Nitrospirota bacterium]
MKDSPIKITVIVPTYNRPQALKLNLLSLAGQSMLPSEVLIADDGSREETRLLIEDMRQKLDHLFPIKHIWQEDIGFRKPMILNETVRQSSGDYLVFIDGDCMAHRYFIKEHITLSDRDTILSGKRVEIGKNLTERLLREGKVLNTLHPRLVWDAAFGSEIKSRKVEEAIIIRNPLVRKLLHRDRITDDGVWGCNFSLYKDLFYGINGCDEEFADGSIEDNDLGIRVLNQGKKLRTVRNRAIIFHLWHKSTWDFSNPKYLRNKEILKRRIDYKEKVCKQGIRRLDG